MIYFITGVSTSGKTTLMEVLRDVLPTDSYFLTDIDAEGVPSGGNTSWRQRRVTEVVEFGSRSDSDAVSTVLSGTVLPEDVTLATVDPKKAVFFLLEADDEAIEKRLRSRYSTPDAKNSLFRVTGLSLSQFVESSIAAKIGMRKLFQTSSYTTHIIDTTCKLPVESAQEVKEMIVKYDA